MKRDRRRFLTSGVGILGAAALPSLSLAQQSAYPSAPVKVVIPTPAGGGFDRLMRIVGEKLTESWGQRIIVESRTGASGGIAAQAVAAATPDGHTLMLGFSALVSNLVLHKNPGYKLSDFEPVSMVTISPIALGVRESLGVKNLKELIALAKSRPGRLSYGSYGPGSGGHFIGELFKEAAGIYVVHIPYRGEAPAIVDLLGEHIDMAVISVGGVMRHPGKIRPMAISSPSRFPLYPDIPTFGDAGFPSVNMPGWGALFAPAGTSAPIVAKIGAEVTRIVNLPDVAPKILELGFEPVNWSASRLATFLREQMVATTKLVEGGRIQI